MPPERRWLAVSLALLAVGVLAMWSAGWIANPQDECPEVTEDRLPTGWLPGYCL